MLPMKPRFLPYFIESKVIDDYLENSKEFFNNLPAVCPFCGWIGDNPRHHGYNDDWMCPVLWLVENVEKLRSGQYVDMNKIDLARQEVFCQNCGDSTGYVSINQVATYYCSKKECQKAYNENMETPISRWKTVKRRLRT